MEDAWIKYTTFQRKFVLKTRAKPVTFLVCCKRAMYLYGKTTIRLIGSLYFPEFFLTVEVYSSERLSRRLSKTLI